jgi:cobalt transport protein ATP-binding subunit
VTAPALEVDDLWFAYPDGHQALHGVTLHVDRGERIALLGPNGAGKTTLALHLNGILRPQRGSVRVGGLPVGDRHLAEIRRRVQLVFADADDQLFMPTVREDVAFGPANQGLGGDELDERVTEVLAAVGAGDLGPRAPHRLSTGEKRRAALATVLAMRPQTLVLDEPTSGLDPSGRSQLRQVLERLPQTQLVITHDLPFALQHCTRSVILDGGRLVADEATPVVLGDDDLLRSHGLELPYGFDRRALEAGPGQYGTGSAPNLH